MNISKNIMKKIAVLFFVFLIIIISSIVVYKEGILPVNKNDQTYKTFVIKRGESLNSIINNLALAGLIRNRLAFITLVKYLGADNKIQAGDFRLSPSQNAVEIIENLKHGTLDAWVTVIEGLRKEEIAQSIAKQLPISEIELLQLATEGYLFPDTYLIPTDATSQTVITIMKNNFLKKYTPDMQMKIKKLNLTEYQMLTLASLVEREAKSPADKQKVASIILKRIVNDWPLQIDATVQYAIGYQSVEKTWWKKHLSKTDLTIDSPYNTYTNPGLPPAPICNPGMDAVQAVVNANVKTPYWYYLSDNNGIMHYSITLVEHEANISKYLGS